MVRITQCLCPSRHCLMAMAYDETTTDASPTVQEYALRVLVAHAIERNEINAECAICGAKPETWTYEDRRSIFRTMEEADPHLKREGARQRATAEFLRTSRN
jgi:hypothetical protein